MRPLFETDRLNEGSLTSPTLLAWPNSTDFPASKSLLSRILRMLCDATDSVSGGVFNLSEEVRPIFMVKVIVDPMF